LSDRTRLRIVQCRVDAATARERIPRRADSTPSRRPVHGDDGVLEPFETWRQKFESFERVKLPAPSIEVDTTDGYEPLIEEIVAFVNRP
jgi:hypothetical protein